MRKQLMATVLLPLGLGLAGVAEAQSSAPVFQNAESEAQRKSGDNQATAELFYMIQQLQSTVRRLEGQVEEQQHQIERLQSQGRDRYVDLDQRLLDLSGKLEKGVQRSSSDDSSSDQESDEGELQPARVYRSPGEAEKETYNDIIRLIRDDKDFDTAIGRLYEFIDDHPEGDLTVNAYYWLGEVYLAVPQLEQAKQAFTIVATRYADHRKAPDAIYKLGVTLDRLDEKEDARRRMQVVVDDYPESGPADMARKYLEDNKS